MKPFRFSLEKVLKVRQVETMKAKQAVAAAQLIAGQAWVAMERARAARAAFEADWEERRQRRMSAKDWAESAERHDALVRAEEAAGEALHKARAVVAEKRAELEEAERREKALDKLREQQFEAHECEEKAADQAVTDEIAQTVRRAQKGVG